jgi:hypothetical protein
MKQSKEREFRNAQSKDRVDTRCNEIRRYAPTPRVPGFPSNGNKAGPIYSTKYESCTRSNFSLLHTKDERQSLKLNRVAKARSKFSNEANHSNLISV